MNIYLVIAALLASNASGTQLVRVAPGRTVPRHCRLWTNLATKSENVAAWSVAAGAPSITSNDFTDNAGASTCETVTDGSAGTQEGYQTNEFSTTPGTYTVSCEMAAGTASSVIFRLSVAGTGVTGHGSSCTFTSLAATSTRYSCTATMGGSPITSAVWQVRIGNVASVTGSVHVCRCQVVSGSAVGPYVPTFSSAVTACR